MRAVIFIERGGNSWTHQWMYEGHCHRGREKEGKSVSHPVVYGLSDLGHILPRLADTRT